MCEKRKRPNMYKHRRLMHSYSYSDEYIKLGHKQKDIGPCQWKHLYKGPQRTFHYHGYIRIQKEKVVSTAQDVKRETSYITLIYRGRLLH